MKLTILGGASVRTPQLIPALVKRAARLALTELWLMDDDAEKLELIGGLCRELAVDAPFQLVLTTDARAALENAQHVIASIRPGLEQGRARDERICFELGVLGQETTGAAGFAMALRSVPPILQYARWIQEIGAPNAMLYNFTNPAGLVAQALHYAGITRVVGICDSANGAQHAVSNFLGIANARVHHTVYGLNHLSWTNSARVDADANGNGGAEMFPALLCDERFIAATHLNMFARGVLDWQQCFLNEYLHYYYHRDEAFNALRAKSETRGEQTQRLTHTLLEQLRAHKHNPRAQWEAYRALMDERSRTYMAHARHGASREMELSDGVEGYAGVVLGCVEAIQKNAPHYTGLNVPNHGALDCLADDDVIEIGCWVDANGIRPTRVRDIPEHQRALITNVKLYERLAARAILSRDVSLAVQALTVHPLLGSYPLAEKLVDAFLRAHREYVGEWQR